MIAASKCLAIGIVFGSAVSLFAACASDGGDTTTDGVIADVQSQQDGAVTDTSGGEDVTSDCAGRPDGTVCDDGNACTTGDTCASGVCTGGTNTVCNASACQVATCDSAVGCVITQEPDGAACEMGCFESASCEAGECKVDPATAVVCPESTDPCVAELACDPATAECTVVVPQPDGTPCDLDDDVCTLDACDGDGVCMVTGDINTCEEENSQAANPCWTWGCNGKSGCVQTSFVEGVSCNDGNACTYADICTVNDLGQKLCQGEPLPINDQNPCTDDACDDGEITHTPIDGISCTVDGCAQPGICSERTCVAPQTCICSPVDGSWSEVTWGDCDVACGAGTRTGTRTCTDPAPSCGGAVCAGDSTVAEACTGATICGEFQACQGGQCVGTCSPVDGGWSGWSDGDCSAECGPGVVVRTRTCTNPAPTCGGAACAGNSAETVVCTGATTCGTHQTCSNGVCVDTCAPVDGGWTGWSWGSCSVECGGGTRTATRTCTSPAPSCGGASCVGDSIQTESCNTQACVDYLPTGVRTYAIGEQVEAGVVPNGVYAVTVYAWGAGGGGGFPGYGGGGAYVGGTVSVQPGDDVEIRVGGGGVAHGGGGGASYVFVNGSPVIIAAGGGGAGSDGCSGCHYAIGGAANGGAGGPAGGAGQDGDGNDYAGTNSGGGFGATASAGGAGGTSNNTSGYSGCESNGQAGSANAGGDSGPDCVVRSTGARYHLGGAQGASNGGAGGGGGGRYGGGSGASKATYTGGGGGGGSSWASGTVSGVVSHGGSRQSVGYSSGAYYVTGHGNGGDAGDYTNWPASYWGPSDGEPGLVVISL